MCLAIGPVTQEALTRHLEPSAERSTLASRVGCPRALHSSWKRRSLPSETVKAVSSWYLHRQVAVALSAGVCPSSNAPVCAARLFKPGQG